MRLAAVVLVPILVFSAFQHQRRKENESRLAAVASAVAGREVGVRCPGFWKRLVEITSYDGWVGFDANGRPEDHTELASGRARPSTATRARRRAPRSRACAAAPRRATSPWSTPSPRSRRSRTSRITCAA